jgi:hypothetical protein
VVFVEKDGPKVKTVAPNAESMAGSFKEEWIHIGEDEPIEIEKLIVEKLVERHERWISMA